MFTLFKLKHTDDLMDCQKNDIQLIILVDVNPIYCFFMYSHHKFNSQPYYLKLLLAFNNVLDENLEFH